MGPGYPNATQSNFQSQTDFLTKRTILPAVMVGPDGILRGSFSALRQQLNVVPPTSMTRTLGDLVVCADFMLPVLWIIKPIVLSLSRPRKLRCHGFLSLCGMKSWFRARRDGGIFRWIPVLREGYATRLWEPPRCLTAHQLNIGRFPRVRLQTPKVRELAIPILFRHRWWAGKSSYFRTASKGTLAARNRRYVVVLRRGIVETMSHELLTVLTAKPFRTKGVGFCSREQPSSLLEL
jgi:hypothetical protein